MHGGSRRRRSHRSCLGLAAYPFVARRFDLREVASGHGDQWVAGGALAITALACAEVGGAATGALHTTLDHAALVVWVTAIAWLPVLVAGELRGPRRGFDLRRWATVFPVGMYAVCSFLVARVDGVGSIATFARTGRGSGSSCGCWRSPERRAAACDGWPTTIPGNDLDRRCVLPARRHRLDRLRRDPCLAALEDGSLHGRGGDRASDASRPLRRRRRSAHLADRRDRALSTAIAHLQGSLEELAVIRAAAAEPRSLRIDRAACVPRK